MEDLFTQFPAIQAIYVRIVKAYTTHNLENPFDKTFQFKFTSEEIGYELLEKSIKFPSKDFFKMRLVEKGKLVNEFKQLELTKYTYHGNFIDNPQIDFIRFDFEPTMRNHAPLHVNAHEESWGDHLTFPDGTNLDITKMNLMKALRVFNHYSENKTSHPLDQTINEPYATIIKGD